MIPTQLHLAGYGIKDIGLGVVVAIFSLVGFEGATAFGEEAKQPLITIPRAVIASLLLTGAFFVFITYVETHALAGNNPTLDQLDSPLSTLSENMGVKWMGVIISLGAMTSFFALAMSCLNAGSRIIFTMGRYGIFPISIGSSHKHNLTPHVAITSFAIVQFLVPHRVHAGIVRRATRTRSWPSAACSTSLHEAGLRGWGSAEGLRADLTPRAFYLKKMGLVKPLPLGARRDGLSASVWSRSWGPSIWAPAYPLNYFAYVFGRVRARGRPPGDQAAAGRCRRSKASGRLRADHNRSDPARRVWSPHRRHAFNGVNFGLGG